MKTLFQIIFVALLTSCHEQERNNSNDKKVQKNSISKVISDSTIHIDTIILNNQKLIQTSNVDGVQSLTLGMDTILKYNDYHTKIDFVDINEDGYKDIRVWILSNTPNQCENYFYDKDKKSFCYIKNSDLDIQLLNGTKFFYSINVAGCGSMNWESHLIKIENWTEINIGLIEYKDCGEKDNGVFIYKINDNNQKLINTMTTKEFKNYSNQYKWILKTRDYWAKNYKTFE